MIIQPKYYNKNGEYYRIVMNLEKNIINTLPDYPVYKRKISFPFYYRDIINNVTIKIRISVTS